MIVISQIVNFVGGYWCIGYWLLVTCYWLFVYLPKIHFSTLNQ